MVIVGLLLVVLGVVGIVLANRSRSRLHAMIGAETLPVRELEEHRQTLVELGSPGAMRTVCEVVGAARPHPDGPLTAPQTGTACVWFRQTVTRKYEVRERDSNGRWRTSQRSQTVLDHSSPTGYAVEDATGLVGLDPTGTAPDRPEQTGSRFEHGSEPSGGGFGALLGTFGAAREKTIGFQYDEWVLRPGTRLYVLGEVHDRTGSLVIGRPESPDTPFIVSTRSEEELREDTVTTQRLWAWGGAAAGGVGLILTVVGLVG